MDLINIWAYGAIATGAIFVWRTPRAGVRECFVMAAAWPVVLPFVIVVFGADLIGWDFNLQFGKKMFDFRRPDDGWKGFAITVFKAEFQFWKKRVAQ